MIPLTTTTRRRIGYAVTAIAASAVVINVAVSLSIGQTDGIAEQIILGASFSVVMVVVMRAAPDNGAVWAFVWGAFCGAWGDALETLVLQRTGYGLAQIEAGALSATPVSLDLLTALTINLAEWIWIGYFFLPIHLLLLFPTGRASSRVWRWAMWAAGITMAASSIVSFVSLGPWAQTPYDEIFTSSLLATVEFAQLLLLLLVPASVGNLILRFRRSTGVERLQFRWLTWAAAVLGLSLVSDIVLYPLGVDHIIPGWISTVALAGIPVSIGIAITKYRLYDIDLVISRSVVFVVLVGFITAVYSGLVVGVGSLVGGSSVGWSIGATALVAVMFEPVRDRVQRWVNRLVYGRRATPYEVLSDLTGRLAATERGEGLLDRMAVRLAEGTGADRAVVWTTDGSLFQPAASNPGTNLPTGPVHDRGALPGTVVPIIHDNEILGALTVETRRGDTLTPTELRLVEDLAGSAGLLMRRVRLDTELEQKAHELEESRRRLVDAQDVERRRLERELNEGPQQRVIALKLQLGLAAQLAREEGADTIVTLIDQMTTETQDAIDQITALANGIYPPVLEAEGLNAAITALAKQAPVDVRVNLDVSARYPLPVEGAVYFCISEALTNATKHGQPPITIAVSDQPDTLSLTVTDTGPGFDTNTITRGAGLNNMADRLDALNGSITINSTPGQPTTITGHIPLRVSTDA